MSERDSICASAEKPEVEYREIAGFQNYRVGSDGSVWSRASGAWKQMKPGTSRGYPAVHLCFGDGRRTYRRVSRLVLEAFVGPRPAGHCACHFPDPSKDNNCIANLSWGTWKENAEQGIAQGVVAFGERHGNARLTAANVRDICAMINSGQSDLMIAERYGVHHTTIQSIAAGKHWLSITGGPCGKPRHKRAKITASMAVEIRRRCNAGESQRAVAADYGLTQSAVSRIVTGEIWRTRNG